MGICLRDGGGIPRIVKPLTPACTLVCLALEIAPVLRWMRSGGASILCQATAYPVRRGNTHISHTITHYHTLSHTITHFITHYHTLYHTHTITHTHILPHKLSLSLSHNYDSHTLSHTVACVALSLMAAFASCHPQATQG